MFSRADLHEVMGLRLGELPFGKPITPAAMRAGMARASYYQTTMRNVTIMAEKEGFSGEDKYTALAFYALLQLESMTSTYLRLSDRMLTQPVFMSAQNPEQSGK